MGVDLPIIIVITYPYLNVYSHFFKNIPVKYVTVHSNNNVINTTKLFDQR